MIAHAAGDAINAVLAAVGYNFRLDFDFTRRVVLTAGLEQPLVPARDMRLSVIRGGLSSDPSPM
jgi:hypothetical protein